MLYIKSMEEKQVTFIGKIIYKNNFENWDTIQSWCMPPQVLSLMLKFFVGATHPTFVYVQF